jgi:spore coat polysaccharide biosynthesis protein SpsF
MQRLGIIIQARTGSTRMPEKVILPFYAGHSILEILFEKLKKLGYPVVLATTINPSDDKLIVIAEKFDIPVFRGSENDVLDRFVQAAHNESFDKIIRVCADNPFLDLSSLHTLIDKFSSSEADYMSFQLADGRPSILTHFGFWAEGVSLKALEKVQTITTDKFYHEHVTNYIYGHPEEFNVQFIEADALVFNRNDIRLTLDTPKDFKLQQEIYAAISRENYNFAIPEIVEWLDAHPEIIEEMKIEIGRNSK